MAFADWDAFVDAPMICANEQSWDSTANEYLWRQTQLGVTRWYDLFFNYPGGGLGDPAPPTGATATDNTTTGAMRATAGGNKYLKTAQQSGLRWDDVNASGSARFWYMIGTQFLCDRLVEVGGLDETSTSLQTTNLPTPALTRYTDGVGVIPFLESKTDWDATFPATTTIIYTNQAGTGSRTGTWTLQQDGNFRQRLMAPFALQAGDTGVRSIESVQLDAVHTGDLVLLLVKPLVSIKCDGLGREPVQDSLCGWNNEIDEEACLMVWSTDRFGASTFPSHWRYEFGAYP